MERVQMLCRVRACLQLFVLVICVVSQISAASALNENPLFQHQWRPILQSGGDATLVATVVSQEKADPRLDIYQNNVKLLSFSPNQYPEALFTLDDGNLATLWTTGGGYWRLYIFRFEKGKVIKVMEGASKFRPEFRYTRRKAISVDAATQEIALIRDHWKNGKRIPQSVDVFVWNDDNKNYDKRVALPWKVI